MITPSFALTATERVLPKLALDFTTASLDSRVTFTRTTGASNPATYIASSGYITSATNNQPRFDYNPLTLVCKGLLIEESRANLAIQSNAFDDTTYWARTNLASVNADVAGVVSPQGIENSDSLIPNTTSAQHRLDQAVSGTGGVTYTFSVYAKSAGYNFISVRTGNGTYASFNLTNGATAVASASVTASTVSMGNGWYRCIATEVLTATGTMTSRINVTNVAATDNSQATFAGNGTSGVYLYGAQIEAGAFATSYIPTTSASLTRNADVATMTGTNFSDWYNASEGTFVYEAMQPTLATRWALTASDGSDTNRITFGTDAFQMFIANGGSTQANLNNATKPTSGNVWKYAGAFKLNNIGGSINAGTVATDATATIPTVNQLNLGLGSSTATTNYSICGYMRKVFFYPQRLTNAELQAFSK